MMVGEDPNEPATSIGADAGLEADDADIQRYMASMGGEHSVDMAEEILHERSGMGSGLDNDLEDSALEKQHTKVKQRGDINILLCGDPGTVTDFNFVCYF